nr:hypothetical protein [Agrobacterium rosae]
MINYGRTEDNLWNQPRSENMGYLDGILWSANIIYSLTFVDYGGTVAKNQNQYTLRNSELAITACDLDRNEYYNALVGQIPNEWERSPTAWRPWALPNSKSTCRMNSTKL